MSTGTCTCFPCFSSETRQTQVDKTQVPVEEEDEDPIVRLDVGGQVFKTMKSTLCTGNAMNSMLHDLVSKKSGGNGTYFLDRDGTKFGHILSWLRDGPDGLPNFPDLSSYDELLREAKHLRLKGLVTLLEQRRDERRSSAEKTLERTVDRDRMSSTTSVTSSPEAVALRPPFPDLHVLKLVGQGSFGSVYYSSWCGVEVAVKLIKTVSRDGSEIKISKSHFEAELSASISHPNLVQTFKYGEREAGQDEGDDTGPGVRIHETWIVQEWCAGGTLRERCKQPRQNTSGLMDVAEICMEIGRAGAYLHDIRIIHGDLTPNNVLIKFEKGRKGFICKVCDFGLARVLSAENQEIITQTMGTVTHMPPELFSSEPEECKLTQKADIYALGMVMYFVVTAKMPWHKMSTAQVVVSVSRGSKLHLPEELPPELLKVYSDCIAFNPFSRPSFTEIVKAMEELHRLLKAAKKAESEAATAAKQSAQ